MRQRLPLLAVHAPLQQHARSCPCPCARVSLPAAAAAAAPALRARASTSHSVVARRGGRTAVRRLCTLPPDNQLCSVTLVPSFWQQPADEVTAALPDTRTRVNLLDSLRLAPRRYALQPKPNSKPSTRNLGCGRLRPSSPLLCPAPRICASPAPDLRSVHLLPSRAASSPAPPLPPSSPFAVRLNKSQGPFEKTRTRNRNGRFERKIRIG